MPHATRAPMPRTSGTALHEGARAALRPLTAAFIDLEGLGAFGGFPV